MQKTGIRNEQLNALFGNLMKQKRLKKGATQTEVASFLGLSQETISEIENGKVKITLTDFVRFAKRYAPEIKLELPKEYKKVDILCKLPPGSFLATLKHNAFTAPHHPTPFSHPPLSQ